MKQQQATVRYLRMTPRKVRMVADLIRGLSASEAEAQLLMQRRRAAQPLLKLLRSALANAKNNQREEANTWLVQSLTVDQGPMLKRYLPRARGSASPIQRKMCHVTLTLVETEGGKSRVFTIQPKKKKSKTGAPETKKARPAPKSGDHGEKGEDKRSGEGPGFFKKVFNRKAGM
jgi:large subunit ribosomal protein L22